MGPGDLSLALGYARMPKPLPPEMLDVRRRMFADGLVVALGMAAFGDADWQLAA